MSHDAAERPIRIAGLDDETWEPSEEDLAPKVDPKAVEKLEQLERENARSSDQED